MENVDTFFQFLLDLLPSSISSTFRFTVSVRVSCSSCQSLCDTQLQSHFLLYVPLSDTTEAAISRYQIEQTTLQRDCTTCSSNTLHFVSKTLQTLPSTLMVVLNRFDSRSEVDKRKSRSGVQIQESFEVGNAMFDLQSLSVHEGSWLTGDCFPIVKLSESWISLRGTAHPAKANWIEALSGAQSKTAHVLIYSRVLPDFASPVISAPSSPVDTSWLDLRGSSPVDLSWLDTGSEDDALVTLVDPEPVEPSSGASSASEDNMFAADASDATFEFPADDDNFQFPDDESRSGSDNGTEADEKLADAELLQTVHELKQLSFSEDAGDNLLFLLALRLFQMIFNISDSAFKVLLRLLSAFVPSFSLDDGNMTLHNVARVTGTASDKSSDAALFESYAWCQQCSSIYPYVQCTTAGGFLNDCTARSSKGRQKGQCQQPLGKLSDGEFLAFYTYPYCSLRDRLAELFARVGFEEMIEHWRDRDYDFRDEAQTDRIYRDVYDGELWRHFNDPESTDPFLREK